MKDSDAGRRFAAAHVDERIGPLPKHPMIATTNLVSALLAGGLVTACASSPTTNSPEAPACSLTAAANGATYDVACPNGSSFHSLTLPSALTSGCTAKQLSDGAAVTCSGKTVYVWDGKDGKDGKNGLNGKDGLNGINGVNGVDGKDGTNGTNGVDGKDGTNGTNGVDGKDGTNGADGKDGKDGTNGTNGVDGKDGTNGTNGVDGKDGTNGADGKDGKDAPLPSPIAFFTETPTDGTLDRTASFAFSATLPGATFACSVDGGPFTACASPLELTGLTAGAHTFSVEASAAGHPDGSPVGFDWSIDRPNILFLLADDLGYSDIHALGGEIDTPNLDALVANGRILTNHHVGTVSAITRSMFISGTDHHLVGEGTMGAPNDERKGLPGYEGYLNNSSLSIAQLLQDAGYHTYIAGKWHLGNSIVGGNPSVGLTPDQWGFEHSYALLGGASGNHFLHEPAGAKNFTFDGAYAQPGQPGQPGGYSTELYTNELIQFIDSNHGDKKPFFAYAAYTSPHWPLAVPEPWFSKYKGSYDQGYDPIRAARIARLKSLGVIPNSLTPSNPAPENLTQVASANNGTSSAKYISAVHPASDGYVDYHAGAINKNWSTLSDLEKKSQARYMEIYAGMVSNLDYHIGRLIQHLQDIGEYEKTFIVFHSDNGAEGWPIDSGADPKATDEGNAAPGVYETLGADNGKQNAKSIHYGLRWAEVSATPFAQFKSELGEGGVSTAAVVHLPGQIGTLPTISWFSHITDDTATFLAVAGVTPPSEPAPPLLDATTGIDLNHGKVLYKGRAVWPVTGISLLPALNEFDPPPVHSDAFGDESYGRAYIFSGDGLWKARWTEPPYGPSDGHWELFYIINDRGETTDVSSQNPSVLSQLFGQWQSYMTRVGGVEPLRPIGFY
jgi:arylsulfatase